MSEQSYEAVGPFSGEPGFELAYWLPFLKHYGYDHLPGITRGGATCWYNGGFEAYDLIGYQRYQELYEIRVKLSRIIKSFGPNDILDREILKAAGVRNVLHPAEVYSRLYESEDWPDPKLTKPEKPDYLPDDYIAVRLYESSYLSRTARFHKHLIGKTVVVLKMDRQMDDHAEIPLRGDMVVEYSPENSLRVVSEVVAHASQFVCTFGGFSYIGLSYDTPTKILHTCVDPFHDQRPREKRLWKQMEICRVAPI